MNQVAAVATQYGFPPREGTLCRLTVHADSVRADLALPLSVPLESLLPTIVDIVSGDRGYQAGPIAIRHQLSLPGSAALDPSKTLAQLRIRDGTSLVLTSSSTELTAPHLDDAAEAISESLADTGRHWNPRVSSLVAMLATGSLAVVSATMLIRTAVDLQEVRAEGLIVAAVASLVSLLSGGIAHRVLRETLVGLTLGVIACGFAAVAGALAVPGTVGAPNALFAAATTATSAAVMRAIGCHTVVFTAITGFATTAAAAALVGVVATIPLHALGAALAATSLLLIEGSASMSIRLAGLSPQQNADCVEAKAISARTWLISLVAAFSASTALGAIGATVGQRLPSIAFAALIGGVLLSRARRYRDLAISLPLIIFGTIMVCTALEGVEAAYPTQAPLIAAASIGLAAVALWLGFVDLSATLSPIGQRSIEVLEYFALAAVLPLTCWICGLYGAARGLNLP